MPREPNAAKKPYSSPSLVVLDERAAKAKLKAREIRKIQLSRRCCPLRLRHLNRRAS